MRETNKSAILCESHTFFKRTASNFVEENRPVHDKQ